MIWFYSYFEGEIIIILKKLDVEFENISLV